MRPVRSLLIYFAVVFAGGALLAPGLYGLAQALALHCPGFGKLASNPFHRFVDRALLGLAVLCLWPLWRSCGMLSRRELGLGAERRRLADMGLGFLFGFGSLAVVALLALLLKGRSVNAVHSGAEFSKAMANAAIAAVLVSIIEEIIFRGTLFGILRKAGSWPAALVISSAVYALVHFMHHPGPSGPIRWWSGFIVLGEMFQGEPGFVPMLLTLFLAGVILAMAYQRTGALFFSMGLHAGWIFWLKSYGFLTAPAPGANPSVWGTDKLIDGWLALPVLGCVCWLVWRMKGRQASI